MDFLLTGASGFLGKNLLLHAPVEWRIVALYNNDVGFPEFVSGLGKANITPVRCDLADPRQVEGLKANHGGNWHSCLYLAAKVDIPWSVREPKQDLLCNTGALLNVLESFSVGRFIYFSSGAVYDGSVGEAHPHQAVSPTLPYAISKLTSEQYVQFYRSRRKSIENYLIVRFFGAYGPHEAAHKIYTRLVRALAIERNTSYSIYGDGKNLIDAMYVPDAVEAIRRMLSGDHWNDIVNLAAGRPLTIEDLVTKVGDALGVGLVKLEKLGVAHERNEFWGSTREMREFFGFEPRVSLREGIVRFKDFLCSSQRGAFPKS